jgi:hypothetical protein
MPAGFANARPDVQLWCVTTLQSRRQHWAKRLKHEAESFAFEFQSSAFF